MDASVITSQPVKLVDLQVQPLKAETWAPFGQIIVPDKDGRPFGPHDAQLDLHRGTPRFYIMSLRLKPLTFTVITRHLQVTQCLASVGGKPWMIAVAPPHDPDNRDAIVDPKEIMAFQIPGNVAIKLHRSTWHAGPYYNGETADFFNLELSDTNQADHPSVYLDKRFGIEYRFAGPLSKD
jgi:ureidoglycolate hydrolase